MEWWTRVQEQRNPPGRYHLPYLEGLASCTISSWPSTTTTTITTTTHLKNNNPIISTHLSAHLNGSTFVDGLGVGARCGHDDGYDGHGDGDVGGHHPPAHGVDAPSLLCICCEDDHVVHPLPLAWCYEKLYPFENVESDRRDMNAFCFCVCDICLCSSSSCGTFCHLHRDGNGCTASRIFGHPFLFVQFQMTPPPKACKVLQKFCIWGTVCFKKKNSISLVRFPLRFRCCAVCFRLRTNHNFCVSVVLHSCLFLFLLLTFCSFGLAFFSNLVCNHESKQNKTKQNKTKQNQE